MDENEFNEIVSTIAQNLDDQGVVTAQLDKLRTGGKTIFTTNQTLKEENDKQIERIKSLKETNMNLFLKTGQPVDNHNKTSPEPLQYEDVIKEMK